MGDLHLWRILTGRAAARSSLRANLDCGRRALDFDFGRSGCLGEGLGAALAMSINSLKTSLNTPELSLNSAFLTVIRPVLSLNRRLGGSRLRCAFCAAMAAALRGPGPGGYKVAAFRRLGTPRILSDLRRSRSRMLTRNGLPALALCHVCPHMTHRYLAALATRPVSRTGTTHNQVSGSPRCKYLIRRPSIKQIPCHPTPPSPPFLPPRHNPLRPNVIRH